MYSYDPNVAYNDAFSPASGSLAAKAVTHRGRACEWIRETGDSTIVISAARPTSADLASLKSSAKLGNQQGRAYFSTDAGSGVVQIFEADLWITAVSNSFTSAADAAPLTDSVLAALR